jgi:regulator of replication initiation timing
MLSNIFGGNHKNRCELLERDNNALRQRVEELEKEISSLKVSMQSLTAINQSLVKDNHTSILSNEKVVKYVEEMLKNPDKNSVYIPDIIEKPAYVNVIYFMLYSLAVGLESTTINILGHRIRLLLEPCA